MATGQKNGVQKRAQGEWQPFVSSGEASQLRLYNSLTRGKEIFKPINDNQLKFYICGPTVYDSAHMGHARAYLSFDIVRRVLETYFNYDVTYVMNITDIDDKIIKRARQGYLFDEYTKTKANWSGLSSDVKQALAHFNEKVEKETDNDKKKMLQEMVNNAVKALEADATKSNKITDEQCEQLVLASKDILSDWLDEKLGGTVQEMSVFEKLARRFENDFLQDMDALNVKTPDILTRVSEYVPEVIEYIEKIIENGYGYKAKDGSVYFDTAAFEKAPHHSYAKLVPEAYGDTENIQKHLKESEGELSIGAGKQSEKRSQSDFALWKSSKVGEPFWDSPWGKGRPGWHIECSAMSSAVCGDKLDIHAGGFDLKFPHHDNEIAQCEAYFDSASWVNYFLHCGTLRIQGSKMSKSLKNFITIKKALETYSARQLRILFLMHTWTDLLDYSTATMEHALQFEKLASEFFLTVKDFSRRNAQECKDEAAFFKKYEATELEVLAKFSEGKKGIHHALCDSIDTRTVIEKIRQIIGVCNSYIKEKESSQVTPNVALLKSVAEYITWLFKMFGVIPDCSQLGFPADQGASADFEDRVMPYLEVLSQFRESVRAVARKEKAYTILKECDRLRDELLPEVGVRLEDKADRTVLKLVDRETLLREKKKK